MHPYPRSKDSSFQVDIDFFHTRFYRYIRRGFKDVLVVCHASICDYDIDAAEYRVRCSEQLQLICIRRGIAIEESGILTKLGLQIASWFFAYVAKYDLAARL